MSKTYRAWDVDKVWLLPASVHDFVPASHPAHLIRELVREELDLSAIVAVDEQELRGYPPYHPAMMTALLLYAYSRGLYSSRAIARALEERLDVMAVTALQRPDFRTVSDFRKRHLAALTSPSSSATASPEEDLMPSASSPPATAIPCRKPNCSWPAFMDVAWASISRVPPRAPCSRPASSRSAGAIPACAWSGWSRSSIWMSRRSFRKKARSVPAAT